MKKILLSAFAVIICLAFAGCKESDTFTVNFESSKMRLFLEDKKMLGLELTELAFEALKKQPQGNFVTSPITDYTLFSEKSKEQMDVLTSYIENLTYSEDSFITPAYAFYIKNDRVLKEELFSGYSLYPSATVFMTDPETPNISRINQYIKNVTSSAVSGVFATSDKELSPNHAVISSMGFTGKWAKQYKSENVKDGIFTDNFGKEQKVKYLCSFESYYVECDGGYGVRKSYRGGDFDFVALLPPEDMSIDEYIRGLDADEFMNSVTSPRFTAVNTRIPKFTATQAVEVTDDLKLPMISEEEVEYYFETVSFSVCENGTEGTSVTTSNVSSSVDEDDPKTVVLNRPFLYAVVDKDTGAPLLAGIIRHVE